MAGSRLASPPDRSRRGRKVHSRGRARPGGEPGARRFRPDQARSAFSRWDSRWCAPYVAGKVPVVFVHGLWGSPRNWAGIIGALEADPFLRERYQALTFGYSGGSSITYSASQLRREFQSLRHRIDAGHEVRAWDRTILIGHSMGGLLCKMMVQDSGSKLWDLMARRPFEKLAGPTDARDMLRRELIFEPVTEARRLIFIATPHRGSRLVCGAVREIGNRLAAPPERLLAGPRGAPGPERAGRVHADLSRRIRDEP